jgi:hypothetical protein
MRRRRRLVIRLNVEGGSRNLLEKIIPDFAGEAKKYHKHPSYD